MLNDVRAGEDVLRTSQGRGGAVGDPGIHVGEPHLANTQENVLDGSLWEGREGEKGGREGGEGGAYGGFRGSAEGGRVGGGGGGVGEGGGVQG